MFTPLQNSYLIFSKKCRSSHQRSSVEKLFLNILQYLQENTCVGNSLYSGHCEIFWSTYFEEHLQTAASENVLETEKK